MKVKSETKYTLEMNGKELDAILEALGNYPGTSYACHHIHSDICHQLGQDHDDGDDGGSE